jgi:hypothetical protein
VGRSFSGVAVEGAVAEGHGPVVGHVDAELDLFEVLASALGVTVGGARCGLVRLGLLVVGVVAIQLDGGEVVVDLADVQAELLDGSQDQGSLDLVAVVGEAFQGHADAVVV